MKCKLEFVICILKIVRNCVFRQSQITRLLRLPICVYIYFHVGNGWKYLHSLLLRSVYAKNANVVMIKLIFKVNIYGVIRPFSPGK